MAVSVKDEYAVNDRFIQGLLLLLFIFLVKKYLIKHIIYYSFSFLNEKIFWNFSRFFNLLTYLLLLNSLFLSIFFVFLKSLNNYFFLITSLFSVNKLHYVVFWYFFCIQLVLTFFMFQTFQGPRFLGSRFFWVQVYQSPDFSGSGSRVWVQVLEVGQKIKSCLNQV